MIPPPLISTSYEQYAVTDWNLGLSQQVAEQELTQNFGPTHNKSKAQLVNYLLYLIYVHLGHKGDNVDFASWDSSVYLWNHSVFIVKQMW